MHSTSLHPTKVENSIFKIPRWWAAAIKNQNRHISATVEGIVIKFCTVMHTASRHPTKVENLIFMKIQDGGRNCKHFEFPIVQHC